MVMWWSIHGNGEVRFVLVTGEGNLVSKTQKGSSNHPEKYRDIDFYFLFFIF